MDLLKGKRIMVWMFMGNIRMYQALRDNTDGTQDTFFSELVRIMEEYPFCDGADIDLEKGDGCSTHAASTAMFKNIYNAVRHEEMKRIEKLYHFFMLIFLFGNVNISVTD